MFGRRKHEEPAHRERQLERGKYRAGFSFGDEAPLPGPWGRRLKILAILVLLAGAAYAAFHFLLPAERRIAIKDGVVGWAARTSSSMGVGYREVYIPPRPIEECLKESGGVINDQTLRCRKGYTTWRRKE